MKDFKYSLEQFLWECAVSNHSRYKLALELSNNEYSKRFWTEKLKRIEEKYPQLKEN